MTLPLTLIEEFLLLSLDDSNGQVFPLPRRTFDCAVASAVLMDLALRNKIDNDLKDMFVVDPSPTGDALLDPVLQVMALAPVIKPQPIDSWLQRIADEGYAIREKAWRRLETRGIVRREHNRVLWVLGMRRYPLMDDKDVNEVKGRLSDIVFREAMPSPHDIMLIALTQSSGLARFVFERGSDRMAQSRAAQIARMDMIAQAMAYGIGATAAAQV